METKLLFPEKGNKSVMHSLFLKLSLGILLSVFATQAQAQKSNFFFKFFQPVDGGTISTTDNTTICVDDQPDYITATLEGDNGRKKRWVITDDKGTILGTPKKLPIDFNEAGGGTCYIYNISYNLVLGLRKGRNIKWIFGLFDLSNPIKVVRNEPKGGTLEGGPYEFTVDGEPDFVKNVSLSGNSGTNSAWVITDDQLNILGLPPSPDVVNFDEAGPGTCLIWHLSFEDGLEGAEVGANAANLSGCFSLSNSITVVRNPSAPLAGGTLEGGPYTFCVDGEADNVKNITLTGNEGENSAWVITDDKLNILGLPPTPEVVNFDEAGPGVCLIWHLSYNGTIEGAEMGANAADLKGDFELSNSITVTRNKPEGGVLEGGPYEFTVDGEPDFVKNVSLSGNSGTNSAWVITDDQLNILGLPPSPDVVNFDEAGPGTCLIWHLSFEDGLEGAEVGANAANLSGCFSLSNSITVVRKAMGSGNDELNAGTLTGGPFEFIIDGKADFATGISVEGASGENSAWIVTDDSGVILGTPPTPDVVNFDEAGVGLCLIWYIVYNGDISDLSETFDIVSIEGDFAISEEPIEVNRIAAPTPSVDGGTLTGGPYDFIVGDGIADNVSEVELTGNFGPNSAWVVTDGNNNILDLPESPSDVNFDLAPEGLCLIWHLSFEDGLEGAEVGANVADLNGVYDLSNEVIVNRTAAINLNGGTLSGEDYEFCVDGTPDNVSAITVTGADGDNNGWVITDEDLNILGLPPTPEVVDFDEAGVGVCLIWHITYNTLEGAKEGANVADLKGNFALSDSIKVSRNDCDDPDDGIAGIKAYFDAASSTFKVMANGEADAFVKIQIMNLQGNVLATGLVKSINGSTSNYFVNTSSYPSGMYVAKLYDKKSKDQQTIKFVIN